MELEVGDVVICTVEKIEKTIVFVKIPLFGKEIEGNIIISEIAPGRIRNIRNYVVPKKKIVCKVLRIVNQRIDLSLRRVTQKERKEVLEEQKKEKGYTSVLKSILEKKAEEVIKKITEKESLFDFFNKIKENPEELEKIVKKEDALKIINIIKKEKQKKRTAKREISLTTIKPNGLELIKEIFGKIHEAEIKYISGGKYALKIESENPKIADNKLKEALNLIEKEAKNKEIEFSIIKK